MLTFIKQCYILKFRGRGSGRVLEKLEIIAFGVNVEFKVENSFLFFHLFTDPIASFTKHYFIDSYFEQTKVWLSTATLAEWSFINNSSFSVRLSYHKFQPSRTRTSFQLTTYNPLYLILTNILMLTNEHLAPKGKYAVQRHSPHIIISLNRFKLT